MMTQTGFLPQAFPYGAGGFGAADSLGDFPVSHEMSVRNLFKYAPHVLLKGSSFGLHGKGEGLPFSLEVFLQFLFCFFKKRGLGKEGCFLCPVTCSDESVFFCQFQMAARDGKDTGYHRDLLSRCKKAFGAALDGEALQLLAGHFHEGFRIGCACLFDGAPYDVFAGSCII